MLELGKEEREKQNAQGKGINSRSHFVLVIETVSVIIFRIDSHTIKRDEIRIKIQLSKCH